MLPEGKRVDDPPKKRRLNAMRFRIQLAVMKYPIQTALLVALMVLLVPVYMLIESNTQLRSDAKRLRESNQKVASSLVYIQQSRRVITERFCGVINDNSSSTNAQNDYLQDILVEGVQESKPFSKTFDSLGLPSYRERLKQARGRAAALEAFKVPEINCGDLFTEIDCQIEALRTKTDPKICERDRKRAPEVGVP